MSVDIVTLVYAADARPLDDATKAFERNTAAAERNDAAQRRRLTATERAGVTTRQAAKASADYARAEGAVEQATRQATREIQQALQFRMRLNRQQAQEATRAATAAAAAQTAADRDAERSAQQLLQFRMRMARQRAQEEAQAAREAAVAQAAADRESERSAQQLFQFRVRMARQRAAEEERAAREATAAVASLEARIDALKGSIDPTYIAQQRLNAEMKEAAALYKMGAISASDYAQATTVLDQRMDAVLRGQRNLVGVHGQAVKSSGQLRAATFSLGQQFADVGVSLAGGINPLMVLIQQGPQITTALSQMKAEGVGTGAALRGALGPIAGLLGPIVIAAGAAAVGFGLLNRELSKDDPKNYAESLGLTEDQLKRVDNATITMGDTFKAVINVMGEYLTAGPIGDAIDWLGEKWSAWLDDFATSTAHELAVVYGVIMGVGRTIVHNWHAFGAALADGFAVQINKMIDQVESFVNATSKGLNLILPFINPAFAGVKIPELDLSSWRQPISGAAEFLGASFRSNIDEATAEGERALGTLYSRIAEERRKVAKDRILEEAGDPNKARQRKEALSEEEKARKRAREELTRYIEKLEEERATYGMTAQQQRTYTSLLQIEAALKLGDLASAKRVAMLNDELNALDRVNEELKAYRENIEKIAKADFTPTTEAMEGIGKALKDAGDEAQILLELFDRISWAAEGIGRALKTGDLRGVARDVREMKKVFDNWKDLDLNGKISAVAGIADGIGRAIGGKAGRAVSNAGNGAMIGLQLGGPVGAAAGAIIGAISTFLGGKKSNEGAGLGLTPTALGALSGKSRTSETEAAVTEAGQAILAGQEALRAAGLTLNSTVRGVVIGTRDLSEVYLTSGETLKTAVGDVKAAAEAALQAVLRNATYTDANLEKLVRSMQETGKTFDEINAVLQEYAAAQGMLKAVNDAILQLTDPQAYDLEMVKRSYDDQVKAAQSARDSGYLTAAQFDELTASLARLNGLQIDEVMARYGGDEIANLTDQLRTAFEAESSALREHAAEFQRFVDSLKAYSEQIRGAMIETLSPGQQLGIASRRFQNVASLAAQGDKGALGQFQGVAETFRQASAQYSPDAATNRRNLAAIQRATQDAYDAAKEQVDFAEAQLAVLQNQVAPFLGDIRNGTLSVVELLKLLNAKLTSKGGSGAVDPVQSAVEALAAQGPTAAANDAFNAAAYLAQNPDVAASGMDPYEHYIRTGQYEIAGGYRQRGFATGGDFTVGGSSTSGDRVPVGLWANSGEHVNVSRSDNMAKVAEALEALDRRLASIEGYARKTERNTGDSANLSKQTIFGDLRVQTAA